MSIFLFFIISRSYGSVLDESIESFCSRLIQTATQNHNENDEDEEMNIKEEEDDDSEEDETVASQIERRLIDEFGACLAEMIASAEKRKLARSFA